jgi:hypothetical protein
MVMMLESNGYGAREVTVKRPLIPQWCRNLQENKKGVKRGLIKGLKGTHEGEKGTKERKIGARNGETGAKKGLKEDERGARIGRKRS